MEHTISAAHVEEFITQFFKYDIRHTGLIEMDHVLKVVKALPAPLGRPEPSVLWMRVLRHELRIMPLRAANKVAPPI